MPVMLGKGIPIFKDKNFEETLELIEEKNYSKGVVEKHCKY